MLIHLNLLLSDVESGAIELRDVTGVDVDECDEDLAEIGEGQEEAERSRQEEEGDLVGSEFANVRQHVVEIHHRIIPIVIQGHPTAAGHRRRAGGRQLFVLDDPGQGSGPIDDPQRPGRTQSRTHFAVMAMMLLLLPLFISLVLVVNPGRIIHSAVIEFAGHDDNSHEKV